MWDYVKLINDDKDAEGTICSCKVKLQDLTELTPTLPTLGSAVRSEWMDFTACNRGSVWTRALAGKYTACSRKTAHFRMVERQVFF